VSFCILHESHDSPTCSGYVAMSTSCNQFMVDNGKTSLDVHNLDGSSSFLQTLSTSKLTWSLPKQVVFAEELKTIVCGSDHGAVYVFSHRQSQPVQVLQHVERELIQTVTVSVLYLLLSLT
jgi:hypothetical protein